MAFFSESGRTAVGKQDMGVQSRFQSIPLTKLGYSTSMPGGSDRPNHSFEFHYDAATTAAFWHEIRVSTS